MLRYLLSLIVLWPFVLGAADQKPLVIAPGTGKQEQLQPGNYLTLPNSAGAMVRMVPGVGSPEGVITGGIGSMYYRTDGTADATLYVKQTGTGNTGWGAVAAGAGPDGINVKSTLFGAIGNGADNSLTAPQAAAYNTLFSSYGAQGANSFVAGDQRDYAAIQSALWVAANTGQYVFIPPGTYRLNRPLRLNWTATPITGQPERPLIGRLFGSGPGTILRGYGIASGRAVLEMLGESNGYAANISVENLVVEQDVTCDIASYCLRLGDGYCGISLFRVICKGINGLLVRVASSLTYAQICFLAVECQFWSNYGLAWGADDASMTAYSVDSETGGALWDSVMFQNCFFWGQANTRATTLKFETCIFVTPPARAVPDNVVVYLGAAAFDNCYFEDHRIGIVSFSNLSEISSLTVRNSHFSSANNLVPPANAASAIQSARGMYEHGPITIANCRFGLTHTVAALDFYGPLSVDVIGCGAPFGGVNTAPSINTAGDVKLITRNPNGEAAYDLETYTKVRIDADDFQGPSTFHQDVAGGATLTASNTDTGAASTAAVQAVSGTVTAQMVAYNATHGTLPGWTVIGGDHPTAPVVIAQNNQASLYVDGTWVKAARSVNSGYGFGSENINGGASALAFYYLSNGTDFAVFQQFGTGHALAGQAFLGTSTQNLMRLGAGGLTELTIDPTDRRTRLREFGVIDGLWYTQTTTQSVTNSTVETNMVDGGQGLLTMPANYFQVGSTMELTATMTEEAGTAVNFLYRFFIGGTAVATPTIAYGGVTAAAPYEMTMTMTVKSIGASGTIAWVTKRNGVAVSNGVATRDTTTSIPFYISVQPDTADTANTVTCPQATFRVKL